MKGAVIRHARKRRVATIVEWRDDAAMGTAALRSGRRFTVTREQLMNGRGWRPWGGHAQASRGRTEAQLDRAGHGPQSLARLSVRNEERRRGKVPGREKRRRARVGIATKPVKRRRPRPRLRWKDRRGKRRG